MAEVKKLTFNNNDYAVYDENAVHKTGAEDIYGEKVFKADTITFERTIKGNILTSKKLEEARNITLSGVISGTTSFDGSGDVTINTSMNYPLNFSEATNNLGELTESTELDGDTYSIFTFKLGNDITLTPKFTKDGTKTITLIIDSNSHTITWPDTAECKVKWPNGTAPTLTGTSMVTLLTADKVNWFGISSIDFN